MIEKERHQGQEINQQLCPFCESSVKNEQHFLISCQNFQVHRTQLFASIMEINEFGGLDEGDKFHFLLTPKGVKNSQDHT